MNAYQHKYNGALAHYTMVDAQVQRAVAKLPTDWETEEELDAYTGRVMEIEKQYNYEAAHAALRQAENELLEWAHEALKSLPEYTEAQAQLEMMFTKGVKMVTVRSKMLNMAVRLVA